MAVCDKCFAVMAENAAFCSECGATVQSAHADNLLLEGSDREVYPELTRANQLRMRDQWQEAEDACVAILRRYPNNATAHALLGDIFADQNLTEQAIHWYEMALELNPAGVAERVKLEQQRKRLEEAERLTARSAAAKQSASTLGRLAPGAGAWTRIVLGLIALMFVAAIFAAGYQVASGRRADAKAPGPSEPAPQPGPSVGVPGIHQQPVPTPPVAQPGGTPEPSQPAMTPRYGALSNDEQMLLNRISQSDSKILSVSIDPRRGASATVSFELASGVVSRDRILQAALETAQTVLRDNATLSGLTVRAMAPRPGASYDTLFVGDCTREIALPPQKPNQTTPVPQNPAEVFTEVYWAPGVQ